MILIHKPSQLRMAFLKLEFGDLHPDPDLEGKLLKESSAWDIRPENGAYAYKYAGLTEYSDSKIFLILRDFLQDPNTDRSFETIVKEILELIPENAQQSTEVWCLSEVFWYLAEQIPYHHPSQIKLVQVVEELSRSVKITVKDYGPKVSCRRGLKKRPLFRPQGLGYPHAYLLLMGSE